MHDARNRFSIFSNGIERINRICHPKNHEKCVHTSKSSKEKPIKLSRCQERLRRDDYSFLSTTFSTYDTILIKKCLSSTFIMHTVMELY